MPMNSYRCFKWMPMNSKMSGMSSAALEVIN